MRFSATPRAIPKQGTKLRKVYEWLLQHPEGLRWSEVRNYYLTINKNANVKWAGLTTSNMLREIATTFLRDGKSVYVLDASKFEQQEYREDIWKRLENRLNENYFS